MAEKVVIEFDHHSPEYREHGMEIAAEARAKCPVAWSESHGGYWVITGLDEASAFQKRPDVFSAFREVGKPDSMYKGISIPFVQSEYGGGFLEMDPPDQLAYRRIVNSFLSPGAVIGWEPMIRELTNASIDEIIEDGKGDFVEQVVNVVPAVLTMAMIGFPLADWVVFNEPAHASIYTPPDSPDRPRVDELTMQMSMRFFELLAEARPNPRPGIMRALIEAEINDKPLEDIAIVSTIGLIVGGGFDTTTALTSETWRYLAEHPEDKARLLSGEAGIWDTATEEFLRYFSPSQGTARSIVQDAEIAGYEFKAGERALVSFSMPNRDPRAFEDPDVLKIDRFPNRHAAFGLGNHRCIGSNLARVSFKTIMQTALERIPEYTIDYDGLQRYEDAGTINGNKNMPMTFPKGTKQGPGLEATIAKYQKILDDEWAAEQR